MKETKAYCDECYTEGYVSDTRRRKEATTACCVCDRDLCSHHAMRIFDFDFCGACKEDDAIAEAIGRARQAQTELKDTIARLWHQKQKREG